MDTSIWFISTFTTFVGLNVCFFLHTEIKVSYDYLQILDEEKNVALLPRTRLHSSYLEVDIQPAFKLLVRFYATACAILRVSGKSD